MMKNQPTSQACLGLAVALTLLVAASPVTANDSLSSVEIESSLCVGDDCTINGEAYGFTTVKLKENNLRILAQDTSGGTFPKTDWQLEFNSSSNGGTEYFAIRDCGDSGTTTTSCGGTVVFAVAADARSNALRVDSHGDVGIGTATPALDLHIVTGNSPSIRLAQDGSSGFTPQTWDIVDNETNFFVRDATHSSRLPFRIRPDAPTSSIDIERTTGDVGFGTASPSAPLHVRRTGNTAAALTLEDTRDTNVDILMQNMDGDWRMRNNVQGNFLITEIGGADNAIEIRSATTATASADTVTIGGAISATAFNTVPSRREYKTAIEPVDGRQVLTKLMELEIARWRYKEEVSSDQETRMSPMAGDFKAAFDLSGDGSGLSINDMVGVALASIQGLAERNRELESEVAELRTLVRKLARRR